MSGIPAAALDDMLFAMDVLSEERGPSIRELTEACDLSSTSVALYRLRVLARQGLVEQLGADAARGWRLTAAGHAYVDALRLTEA